METWEAITSRRNVRSFASQPISAEHLDRILEAARRTPSSRNTQPWDFVLVTERATLEQLSKVWVGAGHVAGSAATIAMVVDDGGDGARRAQFDLGQATMSIMLAAAARAASRQVLRLHDLARLSGRPPPRPDPAAGPPPVRRGSSPRPLVRERGLLVRRRAAAS